MLRSAAWLRTVECGYRAENGYVLQNAMPAGVHSDQPDSERAIDGECAWVAVDNDGKQRAGRGGFGRPYFHRRLIGEGQAEIVERLRI